MSKVDEWILKQKNAADIKPRDFIIDDEIIATIGETSGGVVVTDNGVIDKEDALKFAQWIIENYGD